VEVTVLRAPGGDIAWHLTVADGRVVATAGPLPGATVAVTLPYDDTVAVVRGELAPSVAFMQGRMKTAGDPGVLLDLLAATARPAYGVARDDLLADTEF
jgi:putative sterol carrier protein